MKSYKLAAIVALVFSILTLTPSVAHATGTPKTHVAGAHFTDVVYICGTTLGTGKHSGKDPSNCLPFADETIYTIEANTLIEKVYGVVSTIISGTTDIDVGVSGTSNGFIDGSVSLTLGTVGVYGWDAKSAGSLLRVQTAGATDVGDIYVVPQAHYYASATDMLMDITTANTAGAFQVVIEGFKFK